MIDDLHRLLVCWIGKHALCAISGASPAEESCVLILLHHELKRSLDATVDMTKGAVRKDCKTGMPMVFYLSLFIERPSDQKKNGFSSCSLYLPLQRWAVD
jgi:hypothetical protein